MGVARGMADRPIGHLPYRAGDPEVCQTIGGAGWGYFLMSKLLERWWELLVRDIDVLLEAVRGSWRERPLQDGPHQQGGCHRRHRANPGHSQPLPFLPCETRLFQDSGEQVGTDVASVRIGNMELPSSLYEILVAPTGIGSEIAGLP